MSWDTLKFGTLQLGHFWDTFKKGLSSNLRKNKGTWDTWDTLLFFIYIRLYNKFI